MSDARVAAGPQSTMMAAPLRRAGGEANEIWRSMSDARAAAGPQVTAMAAPLRRAGGEANERGTA